MKTLERLAFLTASENAESPRVGPWIQYLPPMLKSQLLERILARDRLTSKSWPHIVRKTFFDDLNRLVLPSNMKVNDELLNTITESGCCLKEISLSVSIYAEKLTGRVISNLLANQGSLETLRLTWPHGFEKGVLNRIRSDQLTMVAIHASGKCYCDPNTRRSVQCEKSYFYQADLVSMAVNNPTITYLHLVDVVLDLSDCDALFSALSNTLEKLIIKVVRNFFWCTTNHAFYGKDFIPFFEMIDAKCHRLRYVSCFYTTNWDWQRQYQLHLKSSSLQTLLLESHIFGKPLLLPSGIVKLKLSLCGQESSEYFTSLNHEHLPNLKRFYIHLVYGYTLANEIGLTSLFTNLGPKIVSITGISDEGVFSRFAPLICQHGVNLETLGILRLLYTSDGSQLLPLFQDEIRAGRLKHVYLNLRTAPKPLLSFMAENCGNLKTLNLSNCLTLDDDILITLAMSCACRLRALDVSFCSKITDQSLQAVARYCGEFLEEIYVQGTSIGNDGISALALYCTRLTICRFDETKINDIVMKRLQHVCAV